PGSQGHSAAWPPAGGRRGALRALRIAADQRCTARGRRVLGRGGRGIRAQGDPRSGLSTGGRGVHLWPYAERTARPPCLRRGQRRTRGGRGAWHLAGHGEDPPAPIVLQDRNEPPVGTREDRRRLRQPIAVLGLSPRPLPFFIHVDDAHRNPPQLAGLMRSSQRHSRADEPAGFDRQRSMWVDGSRTTQEARPWQPAAAASATTPSTAPTTAISFAVSAATIRSTDWGVTTP